MTRSSDLSGRCITTFKRGLAAWLLAAVCLLAKPEPAHADVPLAYAIAEADLRFGRIVVYGSGARTVTPAGAVTDTGGIVSASADNPGPARFTVGYDRGNEGNKSITVTMVITFGAVPPVTLGGVTASVTNLTSNLAGALTIVPGQTHQFTVANCRTRRCGVSFDVGGKLDVTRTYGGAEISTPVPVSVTVVSVN